MPFIDALQALENDKLKLKLTSSRNRELYLKLVQHMNLARSESGIPARSHPFFPLTKGPFHLGKLTSKVGPLSTHDQTC